ncbi:HTH domain protein [compost metagenome]
MSPSLFSYHRKFDDGTPTNTLQNKVINMSAKLNRLLRIINLIQSYPGVTAPQLADECEVDLRTIRRDIQDLSKARIPITTLANGRGYRFMGNFSLYPINWTEEEALAFSILPSLTDSLTQLLPPHFYAAHEKVMSAYSCERNRNTEVLEQVASSIQLGKPAHQEGNVNFLAPIIQATIAKKTIKAEYYTQSTGSFSKRLIDPYYLIPRENRFYVIGFCHFRKGIRVFRVSRFHSVEIIDATFKKVEFNIQRYMKNTWSITRGDKLINFKVHFSPSVAGYVKEEELFVEPILRDFPDGTLELKVTLNHHREFLEWLAKYGPEAEIIEPVEYREEMKKRLARWSKLYEET